MVTTGFRQHSTGPKKIQVTWRTAKKQTAPTLGSLPTQSGGGLLFHSLPCYPQGNAGRPRKMVGAPGTSCAPQENPERPRKMLGAPDPAVFMRRALARARRPPPAPHTFRGRPRRHGAGPPTFKLRTECAPSNYPRRLRPAPPRRRPGRGPLRGMVPTKYAAAHARRRLRRVCGRFESATPVGALPLWVGRQPKVGAVCFFAVRHVT